MSVFNPPVPGTSDPNYLGLSKSISQPQSDQSTEYLLKGIGDNLNLGIKAADLVVKKTIDENLYSQIDEARDTYTSKLWEVRDSKPNARPDIVGGTAIDGMEFSGQSRKSAGETPQGELPMPLQNLDTVVNNLQGGLAAGKISNVYYHSRLNTIAKDMRAQYPGYREYIDEKISSITGVNPANAQIQSLLQDINRLQTGADKDYNRAMTSLDKLNDLGVPFANIQMQKLRAAGNNPEAISNAEAWVNEQQMRAWELKRRKDERDEFKGSQEEKSYKDRQDATYIIGDTANNYLKNLRAGSGLTSVDEIRQRLFQHETGQKVMSAEEATKLGTLMQTYLAQAKDQVAAQFRTRRADGTSIEASLGGPKAAAEFIDNGFYQLGWISRRLTQNDIPAALYGDNVNKAIYSDTKSQVLKDADMRKILGMQDVIKEMAPAFQQKFVERSLVNGMMDPFKTFLEKNSMEMMLQQDPRVIKTANDVVDEAKRARIPLSSVYSGVIKQAEMIYDNSMSTEPGSDKLRIGLARSFFDSKNLPMLVKFEKESVDENGNVRPGQHSVFNLLTSPVMTSAVDRLSKTAGGTGLLEDYVNNSSMWFKHLYTEDLKEISKINLPKNSTIDFSNNPETGLNQFRVMYKGEDLLKRNPGQFTSYPIADEDYSTRNAQGAAAESRQLAVSLDAIRRINKGLINISAVAKTAGADVAPFLLNTMAEAGFSPTGRSFLIPDSMMRAVTNSKFRKEYEEKGPSSGEGNQ